jgi:hypothetical protein
VRARSMSVIATAALLSFTACTGEGSPDGSGPVTVDTAEGTALPQNAAVPVPRGKSVLTLTGVDRPNVGKDMELDLAALASMPTVEVTVFEPFLKRDILFEGVLLSDVLGYAGVDPAADMRVTALDDYRVDFSLDQLAEDRVLVATRMDGQKIEIPDGGPTRFIFLDASSGLGTNTDNWVWSLAEMAFTEPTA